MIIHGNRKNRIAKMFRNGYKISQIAHELELTVFIVMEVLIEKGIYQDCQFAKILRSNRA